MVGGRNGNVIADEGSEIGIEERVVESEGKEGERRGGDLIGLRDPQKEKRRRIPETCTGATGRSGMADTFDGVDSGSVVLRDSDNKVKQMLQRDSH